MPSKTLFFTKALAGALLVGQVFSTPVKVIEDREVKTVDPPLASVIPKIIQHGPLSDEDLEKLKEGLIKVNKTIPLPGLPEITKRQQNPDDPPPESAIKIERKDGLVSVTVDRLDSPFWKTPPTCTPLQTVNGPIKSLQIFMGSEMHSLNLTSVDGNTTHVKSALPKVLDSGLITLDPSDPIKEFYIFTAKSQSLPSSYRGLNFTTTSGKTFEFLSDIWDNTITGYKVPVGSGILGRFRAVQCDPGQLGIIGFDFIDDIESVSISNIAYSGFTNNIMPAGPGSTVTVGSQVVDNRNSSTEQMISLQTTESVTKQRSISMSDQFSVGGRVSIEAEAGLPLIGKSSVTTEMNWQVTSTNTQEEMESSTITKSTTVNLRCAPGKYCVGTSFYTSFKMDVDIQATFRAKTKSNGDFFWVQKGKYRGADSLALQLQVDEADRIIRRRIMPVSESD